MTKAVGQHHRTVHPKVTKKQWLSMMARSRFLGKPKPPKVGEVAAERAAKKRAHRLKGHRVFDFTDDDATGKRAGKRQWWCADCLQLVAGYGYTTGRQVYSCKAARKREGAARRVRTAWKALLKKPRAEELRQAARTNQWIRDLTQDGDVDNQTQGPKVLVRKTNISSRGTPGEVKGRGVLSTCLPRRHLR